MAGNTLRKKQEIIKQQEKQIKQYEELLMAISKENREIREREDLLKYTEVTGKDCTA